MPPQKIYRQKITKQLEHHDLEQYRSLLEDLFTADQDQRRYCCSNVDAASRQTKTHSST